MENLNGIYPVLISPVTEDNQIDAAGLESQVDFCVRCGAHGLVYPVLGSEFQYLSESQRREGIRTVIKSNANRVTMVAGVAGATSNLAQKFAAEAAEDGANALIALPPYIAPATESEIFDYYRAISEAGLPVFLQNAPMPGISAELIAKLIEEIDLIQYVKEERPPSAHNLSRVIHLLKDTRVGIFGGAFGRWMLSELDRGACGFMPASDTADVYVAIWNAWQANNKEQARDIFDAILPLINLYMLLGFNSVKHVLVQRGIIDSAKALAPGAPELDKYDIREIDIVLKRLQPYMSN